MPPRSTNAPNSAMFLTTPLRIWPARCSRASSRLSGSGRSSISLRRETTMLRRCLVDLEDHALDVLVDVVADVRRPANIHLAGRAGRRSRRC